MECWGVIKKFRNKDKVTKIGLDYLNKWHKNKKEFDSMPDSFLFNGNEHSLHSIEVDYYF